MRRATTEESQYFLDQADEWIRNHYMFTDVRAIVRPAIAEFLANSQDATLYSGLIRRGDDKKF